MRTGGGQRIWFGSLVVWLIGPVWVNSTQSEVSTPGLVGRLALGLRRWGGWSQCGRGRHGRWRGVGSTQINVCEKIIY